MISNRLLRCLPLLVSMALVIVGSHAQTMRVRLVPEISVSSVAGDRVLIQAAPAPNGPWVDLSDSISTAAGITHFDPSTNASGFYRSITTRQFATALMVEIPAGQFIMGDEADGGLIPVSVSRFKMDRHEATKAVWDSVRQWGATNGYVITPGHDTATNKPVTGVNWLDVAKWNNARSEMNGLQPAYFTDAALTQVYRFGVTNVFVNLDAGFRLPTSAEWEKAARGGASGLPYAWSDLGPMTPSRANYFSSEINTTRPVGSYQPNGFGIFDMCGNVAEWVLNRAGAEPNPTLPDPTGPQTGNAYGSRGGSFASFDYQCRIFIQKSNSIDARSTDLGFRSVIRIN